MSKQIAYVLIGLPGSGKSTWTESKMKEVNPRGIGVVSRDSIRNMINGSYKYVEEQQDLVTDIAACTAKSILKDGRDLIIDQTNINKEVRDEVTRFLRDVLEDIEIHFIYLCVLGTGFLTDRRVEGDARGEHWTYHKAVIEKMQKTLEAPSDEEDYDKLFILDAEGKIVDQSIKCRAESDKNDCPREIPQEELWCLNTTLAKYIYPRLKEFRDYGCGGPGGIGHKTGNFKCKGKYGPKYNSKLYIKHWSEILDKMVDAFELWLSSDDWDCEINSKEYNKRWSKIEEGFNLFTKWFGALWW